MERSGFYDAVVVGSGYGGSVAACRLSMAGFNVCLLEKGKKWEAQDFPTDCFKTLSAVRVENTNLVSNFGSKDALFQIFCQDDSLTMVACGLGGGSLVNAGVLLPTTVHARKDPRWPKAWENDWDRNLSSALDMLKGQRIPTKFQNSKVMDKVTGDEYDRKINDKVKLSINFDIEEDRVSDPRRNQEQGTCLACGNCLSGCPYDAKLSNDKTYLTAAIQAGCTILTECEVQYVVRNEDQDIFNENGGGLEKNNGRWIVFLDEFNYITSNVVILSAGVLGTAKILFQSQLRGLQISEKLGSGLSCNGNNVAFLSDSSAPLNAVGLDRKQFYGTPFSDRPGPSITSLLTSSLGFTVQTAVVPRAYPRFIFKGLHAYGLLSPYGFLYGIIDFLKQVSGFDSSQDMVLNVMGHDDSGGKLTFEKKTNKVLFKPPHDRLLSRKTEALNKIAKKLGGVLYVPRYRSLSVHLLGGCVAAPDISSGVCNPEGQVFDASSPIGGVHRGLYICDASVIPCSVGINPCLTITAAAEYISRNLIRDLMKDIVYVEKRNLSNKQPCSVFKVMKNYSESKVRFTEIMRGKLGGKQCVARLIVNLNIVNKDTQKKSHTQLQGKVSGYIECKSIEMERMHIIYGWVDLCETKARTPYTQYMNYRLLLAASSGARYEFEGRKIMNPYLLTLYAWRESTTLMVTLKKISSNRPGNDLVHHSGKLHISLFELLKSLWSMKGESKYKFMYLLMQSLFRTYCLQVPRGSHHALFDAKESTQKPYPHSAMHDLITGDGVKIRIQHWECISFPGELKLQRKRHPVLLVNGYSTESYCLPTEPTDLVRTLLNDGHDVWLLHGRCHWSIASNDFSIEDIGRFDIPAATAKMNEFYGGSIKFHLIGHCIGGLSCHIALMGGYVSTKQIASLTCSNGSMFYKLTKSTMVKLWLPLLPISMMVLGENTVLPMLRESPTSFRHKLMKQISRLIPRYERCTCDECEVASGIFGNAFWHENVSPDMHHWMNMTNLPELPMSGFRHLRKICNAGFVVDSDGTNCYLMHPERMAFPTLYVSGGRTLLVTPETSFLAQKYMKTHQPSFRHERVVVDGYGHSDLWIGEKSAEKVFPHVRKHIRLAEEEEEEEESVSKSGNEGMNEALSWSHDPYEEDDEDEGYEVAFTLILLVVVIIFLVIIVF